MSAASNVAGSVSNGIGNNGYWARGPGVDFRSR
jgi:hypothetical protein